MCHKATPREGVRRDGIQGRAMLGVPELGAAEVRCASVCFPWGRGRQLEEGNGTARPRLG